MSQILLLIKFRFFGMKSQGAPCGIEWKLKLDRIRKTGLAGISRANGAMGPILALSH